MNKNSLALLTLLPVIFLAYHLGSDKTTPQTSTLPQARLENGIQIVDLVAKGGYYPNSIQVKPGLPIKLKVETKNTFDCSTAFQIPTLKIDKFLPPNSITEFDLPALSSGQTLEGNCSMYMYKFKLYAN